MLLVHHAARSRLPSLWPVGSLPMMDATARVFWDVGGGAEEDIPPCCDGKQRGHL